MAIAIGLINTKPKLGGQVDGTMRKMGERGKMHKSV